MRRALFVGLVMLASLGSVSCALYGVTRYSAGLPKILRDDRFAVTIDGKEQPPQADMHATDYLMSVQVENVSASEQVFDTGELELKDLDTGISYSSRRGPMARLAPQGDRQSARSCASSQIWSEDEQSTAASAPS